MLALGAHRAAAQPSFAACNTAGQYIVSGTPQDRPCNAASVAPAGAAFLFACGFDGAVLCDGDGSGPSPANCSSVGMLGCSSAVNDVTLAAGADMVWAACGDVVQRCQWDAAAGAASSCVAVSQAECPGTGGEQGVALTATFRLVLGCYSMSTGSDAGVLLCPLQAGGAAVQGTCQKLGADPCGSISGQSSFANFALSLPAAGGIAVACGTQGTACCSAFSDASGPSGCAALSPTSPCAFTKGVAQLPSGQTGVGCDADGFRICTGSTPSRSPRPAPSARPSAAPAGPTTAPSAEPSPAPSGAPSAPPGRQPSGAPSRPPTEAPSRLPTEAPHRPPSAAPSPGPSGPPSEADAKQPTGAPAPLPSAAPSRRPSPAPSLPPSVNPSAGPSGGPWHPPRPAPPAPPAAPKCAPDQFRDPAGECILCSAALTKSGCKPEGGGYPAPSADGASCVCKCRYYWTGEGCTVCPTGMGGLDCDRCAVGDAEPPRCVAPKCAEPSSLPAEVATECGGGEREVALQPALYHKGLPFTVTIAASAAGPPQLSLPGHVPAQRLSGGALAVRGAELQLSQWLQLRILPAAPLTHEAPITVKVNISGIGCAPVSAQLTIRCPAPPPRVSGALPSAAVPEGGGLAVPCALAELAHVSYPFSARTSTPGVTYNHSAQLCTVQTSGLPSPLPENGITATVTVVGTGAEVPLPLHIEVNPPACRSGVRWPLYVQLPPSGKGYESVGAVALDTLADTFRGFQVIGQRRGVEVFRQLAGSLRVVVSHEAVEGTLFVRLLYSAGVEQCAEAQPVRTFWGPGIVGPTEHIRQPVLLPFAHVLRARAVSSVGSLPWCPEPRLRIAQQPGGLQLSHSGSQWVLSGAIRTPGVHLVYITATDCRGGSARIRVELYGVAGTELGALPDTSYLEDTPLQIPLPRVLSTEKELTLSVAPRLDTQLQMGALSAQCPGGVSVTLPREAGLAIALGGPAEQLGQCRVTLTPAPDGCNALRLVWRAAGQAQEQLLSAVCGPDPPVATPRHRFARWGEYVEAPISTLVRSVDHDQCLVLNTDVNESDPWLTRTDSVIGGYAPDEDAEQCQVVNAYTCRTNLSAQTRFCAASLPDARMGLAPGPIECVEDTPCPLHGNVSIEKTRIARNDTVIYLVFWSSPPVLRGLRFSESTADAPEVRPWAEGELRVEGTLEQLRRGLGQILLSVAPDFDATVNISVRGAVGTAVAESGPLSVRYRPVNDAPRCNGTAGCAKLQLGCGLLSGGEEDLARHYKDVDDGKLSYGANETSLGVRVAGSRLTCSSFIAVVTFYGIPYSGSARVFAVDPSGAVSPALKVEVTYKLTSAETWVFIALTVAGSVYGSFFLLFRPGVVAAVRNLRRRLGGDRSPGVMLSRIGRRAAAQLRAAELPKVAVYQAGCGLWWLRDDGGIRGIAASAKGGAAAVADCGDFLLGVQPESAFDPGERLLCAALSPKRLAMGSSPRLSVLHADPEAELKLCLRLRHKGDSKAALVWAMGVTRVAAAALGSGPDLVEYGGTARQLTEFAHMQRVAGPAGCRSELVWTLCEARSDRALLGGALPVAAAGEATLCGGEEAASPKAAGAAPEPALAAPACGPLPGGLSQPLLPPEQQQQPQSLRPNLNDLRPSHVPRSDMDALRREMGEMMELRVREAEARAEQRAEQRAGAARRELAVAVQRARTAAAHAHLSAAGLSPGGGPGPAPRARGGPLRSPPTLLRPPSPPPRRSPTRRPQPLSPPARRRALGPDPPPLRRTE